MPRTTIRDVTIAFDDYGAGAGTLLLIHGHPFNRSMWQPQVAPAVEAGWRVVAPDLRGYGGSTTIPGTTPLDVFAADLAGLLDHLGVEHAVVCGLSMGGQIAMQFARSFRSRVQGIVLAATFPQAETPEGRRDRHAMAERLLREGMAAYAVEVLPKMLAARSIETEPALAEHVLGMMRSSDPVGAAAALRGRAERPSYEETLASLDVPGLVVVGSEDAFTSRADADRMGSLLRQSELLWLEGAGHMPNLERPAEFNAALLRLLGRSARGARPDAVAT